MASFLWTMAFRLAGMRKVRTAEHRVPRESGGVFRFWRRTTVRATETSLPCFTGE